MKDFTPIQTSDLAATIGANLKAKRLKAKLTIEKMADSAGVARRSYHDWELARNPPRFEGLVRLCNWHKVSIEQMLKGGK
jgi:transcriptional regulator with XRE-family HTH domain